MASLGTAERSRRVVGGLNVQVIETLLSRISLSGDGRLPSCIRVLQSYGQVGRGELVACFLWPLHEAYIIPIEGVAKARINPFMRVFESIEIKVMQV
jgi:hypothetical protein